MSTEARSLRLFNVDEYHAMLEAGILDEDDRVELLDGRIVTMAAIGSRHAARVNRLTELLVSALAGRAIVQVQNPVRLNDWSEPEPDLSVIRRRDDFYDAALPLAADTDLVIEVADSSGAHDRRAKIPRYADARIPEVWLFDLVAHRLEVHREPRDGAYTLVEIIDAEGRASPAAFTDVAIDIAPIVA